VAKRFIQEEFVFVYDYTTSGRMYDLQNLYGLLDANSFKLH